MSEKIRSNCLYFSSVMVFMLIFQFVGFGQATEVDALVEQGKKSYGSIAVLATQEGKPLYQKESTDFTINSQEPIGAASGWFTAALVLYMADQGKIRLDDPVAKYLPNYKKYAKSYLTIRHCLMHTTGLEVEKGGLQKIFQKTKFASLEEEVDAFASRREIVANPGQEYYFSNIGLNIAARVLEVVSKKSFDRLATEKLFRPLGMKKTSFANEAAVNPTSGAISTAADYNRFLTMLLNKGSLNGKVILSEKVITQLLALQPTDARVVSVPRGLESAGHSFGAWAQDKTFFAAGLFGSYFFIDTCRQYTGSIVVKPTSKEDKLDYYFQLKEALDGLAECR